VEASVAVHVPFVFVPLPVRMRSIFRIHVISQKAGQKIDRNQGTARAISSFIDPSLSWEDIKWFRSITRMPIVLKGIQCGEDAVLAVKHGVQVRFAPNVTQIRIHTRTRTLNTYDNNEKEY
jgi:isopentenyl diphosphate isomerase/L-lactate dehydrogenase-like FMN-dependent dehydrogenase